MVESIVVVVEGGVAVWRGYFREVPVYIWPLRINFPPVFLQSGMRFGIHVHSTYDHYFSVCEHDEPFQTHQGHFWHCPDGVKLVAWLSSKRSLRFKAHFCTWGRWGDQQNQGGQLRYEVQLETLSLAGGIGGVDVLAEAIVPAACDLHFEVREDGVWKPFASDTDGPTLDGGDTTLQFKAVFTGTTDLMPGLSLDESEVTLERAAAATFHHISDEITFGTASNHVKVTTFLHEYVEANHDCVISIHYDTTNKAADATVDEVLADGSIKRTSTFDVTTVSACQIKIDGAQNGTGDPFFVSQRIAYATV